MENNRKPPMPGPYYPPFSAGLVGPVSDDLYAAMLDARAQAEAAETAQEAAETAQGKAEDAQEAAETAQGKAEDAQAAAETAQSDAEAYGAGTRGGEAVGSSDPAYHNNAKYYSEQAAESAATLEIDDTLSVSGHAADAKATGDNVMKWYTYPSAPNTFTIGDMPRFSYTYCDVDRFADAPSGITSGYICVVRRPFNSAGNISYVTVQSNNTPKDLYYGKFSESQTFGGWTKVATNSDIPAIDATLTQTGEAADAKVTGDHLLMWYTAPASPATFGISDMPRSSYTYLNSSRFSDAPDGADGYACITRRPFNSAGNMSLVTFQSSEHPEDYYYGKFTEGVTFGGWTKFATQDAVNKTLGISYNLIDKDSVGLLNAYFGSNRNVTSSNATRMLYVPVKPDTDYIYSYVYGAYTNTLATSADVPAVGDTLDELAVQDTVQNTGDGRRYRHIRTPSNAAYLEVYFYNSTHDTKSAEKMLAELMLTEGADYKASFRDYKQGKMVTRDQTPINPYGIFGIRFKRNATIPRVERIYDAEGLTYRQQTGDTVEKSDFDKAFPWSDMRECNVTVDENGKKTIVYSGETGFSRSNNTFIEIPAFYFKRTVVNGVEEWCISGRPFSGADLEPWFLDSNGSPLKYRYIAKYEGADGTSGISVTGVKPKTGQGISTVKALCEASNYSLMDVYGYFALSHLMAIECGALDLQTYNIGISYMAYSMSTSNWNHPTNTASGNVAVLEHDESDPRLTYLNVGDTIYISDTSASDTDDPRLITAIEFPTSTTVSITFSGDAHSISPSVFVFPAMQLTGRTDDMTYVNGRVYSNAMNSPFQYRGIENPYGNVWEIGDNVVWTKATGKFTIHNTETSFTAPEQTSTGSDTTTGGWIKTLGYDRDMPWATLPETVGSSLKNKYISDEWNSGSSNTSILVFSGGWDHQSLNGAFIARGIGSASSPTWLYGYRAMI